MVKTDRSVVRNQAYQKKEFSIRERHNERKNESYYNADIQQDRRHLNVYFRQCGGSYSEAFDSLLSTGAISTRGLKADAKVFDELVFDVNTEYFDQNGGYEYAKSFFEEAYRMAVREIGGEDYILSAVMHADERNKALSERLGRDVYHYHLHVSYVPVVDKEIYFKKNNKNPELAGKLKEVIKQVSHSKKWPRYKTAKGWVNSYSLLQDSFYEHMKEAGFNGFERGERGSTAEHLSVLEYKAKQEADRANQEAERAAAAAAEAEQKQRAVAAMTAEVEQKREAAAELDQQAAKKRKQLGCLEKAIAVKMKAAATVAEVDAIGKPVLFGGFTVTVDEMRKLKNLARKSVKADEKVADMKHRLNAAEKERDTLKAEKAAAKKAQPSIMARITWYDKLVAAFKRAPKRLMAVIEDILRQPPEKNEPERTIPARKRSTGLEL